MGMLWVLMQRQESCQFLGDEKTCVCRGVLRVWGMRIQDSRTDFGGFWRKVVRKTSTRGWCKIGVLVGESRAIQLCNSGIFNGG
jgi:hypothetical protein